MSSKLAKLFEIEEEIEGRINVTAEMKNKIAKYFDADPIKYVLTMRANEL